MAEEKIEITEDEVETPNAEQTDEVKTETESCEESGKAKAAKTDKKTKKLEAKIAELEAQIEAKDAELAAQNDKYLRVVAEYDNFRKRSAKEKEGIYSDAYADALKNILPMIDNLERAVGVEGAEAVAKGLEMTLKGAAEALSKMGVEAFGASGDQFDPNMHSAMMMVDDENHKEGEIVTVFQKGYKKGDKIIRYAMVTVAN